MQSPQSSHIWLDFSRSYRLFSEYFLPTSGEDAGFWKLAACRWNCLYFVNGAGVCHRPVRLYICSSLRCSRATQVKSDFFLSDNGKHCKAEQWSEERRCLQSVSARNGVLCTTPEASRDTYATLIPSRSEVAQWSSLLQQCCGLETFSLGPSALPLDWFASNPASTFV